ncbi:MAG: copper transporter [Streptosporangiales bacterium]|nr:copper transporter [Streptosporangiales bacterium]
MIDFRYHLVSIVAVFLALAIGIVLGSTELQGHTLDVLQSTSDSLRSQLNATSNERDTYQAQAGAAQQFLQTAEPALLSGRLSGQRVVLITEPGAESGVVSGVRRAAGAAGATVTGQVSLQPKFNDISGATQSSLGTINTSIAGDNGITLTQGSSPQTAYQQQAAQLIAAAILKKSGNGGKRAVSAASAQTLLSAYSQGGYLSVSGSPADRAALAIVVTPASPPPGGQNDPANQVLLAAVPEFAAASAATVAVGSTAGSAQEGSSIAVLRAGSTAAHASTVDNADSTLGQISAVQALAAQLAGGKPNSYGVSGASAVSPEPMPSPIPTATASPRPDQTGKANR